ncbi:hypothetical protein [Micromonospora sp. HM5-17]|jgi:hypothetical protein|uniref:hypothetical protein n=1 Tax=Micromonospora sp. HM5-17 TaxID=2487710 RepID=UPI000F4689A3|nr:hypothetical protein [Micromonospora sp. HM5-17]ROT29634.1 hypothetical protein EF879_18470 [Micromonospora sp. HM5-17]
MNLSHLPLRVAIGAYVLNSGLSKVGIAETAAGELHGMAAGAIPPLRGIRPGVFATALAGAEIALGAALLVPVVPSALAGLGLVGFSGGLIRLYWATPGMREPGGPRPTQQGSGLAKDVWLLGAGLTLVLDDLLGRAAGTGRPWGRTIRCRLRRR